MYPPDIESMQHYIRQNYCTLPELAEACQTTESEILKLIANQCIPAHAYEIRTLVCFSNALIHYPVASDAVRYYPASLSQWIKKALLYSVHHNLTEVSRLMREDFNAAFHKAFSEIGILACKDMDEAWAEWVNGTWGICLKELSIECMAKKEQALHAIRELQDRIELSEEERIQLLAATNAYYEATRDFDPYFAPKSTRYREVEVACQKWSLNITLLK